MASLADSLSADDKRNVARLVGDPGWQALCAMATTYRQAKFQWATSVVLTEQGLDDMDRHFWRGYLAALESVQSWPGQIAQMIEREAQPSE